MKKIILRRRPIPDETENVDRYFYHDGAFPCLMVNTSGEIVLVTGKKGALSKGVLVGKTEDSKSKLNIGQFFTDWEVVGPLTHYDGEITVTFVNELDRIDSVT
jgi:hypothetical protein